MDFGTTIATITLTGFVAMILLFVWMAFDSYKINHSSK